MMSIREQIAQKEYANHINQQTSGKIMGAAAAIGSQEAVRKEESGLMRELRYMEKNLYALGASIDTLNTRLGPVLIPAPVPDVGLRNTTCVGSSLTHQLADFNALLADQLTRLDSITQGLDL